MIVEVALAAGVTWIGRARLSWDETVPPWQQRDALGMGRVENHVGYIDVEP